MIFRSNAAKGGVSERLSGRKKGEFYSCAAGRRHNIHFIIFLAEFVFFFTAGVDLSVKNIYNKCVRVKAPFLRALKCPKHAGQTERRAAFAANVGFV